jgi:hypothetical protein
MSAPEADALSMLLHPQSGKCLRHERLSSILHAYYPVRSSTLRLPTTSGRNVGCHGQPPFSRRYRWRTLSNPRLHTVILACTKGALQALSLLQRDMPL